MPHHGQPHTVSDFLDRYLQEVGSGSCLFEAISIQIWYQFKNDVKLEYDAMLEETSLKKFTMALEDMQICTQTQNIAEPTMDQDCRCLMD